MNKSIIITALLAVAFISFINFEKNKKVDAFEQWKIDFGTHLDSQEQAYRRIIFEKNLKKIQTHNTDPSKTYKMGVNQFTIYTEEEFRHRFLIEITMPADTPIMQQEYFQGPNIEIDWTEKGGVSKIKNQGHCGSCWAFSATGVCESWSLIEKKTSVDLSEQQLVDCSGIYGNQGCNGGFPGSALRYIKAHGLASETQYPYTAKTGKCQRNGGNFHIPGHKEVFLCSGIQNAISHSPLTVTVDASNWSHYASGVFNDCGHSINHAVLLVGVVGGNWKIKNSWGTTWGEKGFIRLASGDTCGVCARGANHIA